MNQVADQTRAKIVERTFPDEVPWVDEEESFMDPGLIQLDNDAKGWHRFICYETMILPVRCYFTGSDDNRTLHIVVTEESLKAEPLRVPSSDHPLISEHEAEIGRQLDLPTYGSFYFNADEASEDERTAADLIFKKRRGEDMSVKDLEAKIDEIVFIPWELKVVKEEEVERG